MDLLLRLQKSPVVGRYKYPQSYIDLTMEELLDMITTDESPADISDKIKELLFAKSAERVDAYRPVAANSMFGDETELEDSEDEE